MGGQTPVQDMSLLAPAIYTVLHLFSGSGGLAKGFHDAGFESAGNIDMDPRACIDLRNLCGTKAIEADIGAMGPADLLAHVPVCPDVAASSSPCVGFSGCLPEATSKTAKYGPLAVIDRLIETGYLARADNGAPGIGRQLWIYRWIARSRT